MSSRGSTAAAASSPQQPDELLPITDAAQRLRQSPWTLKRMYKKGHLPAVISGGRWFVPESFVSMVFASPRPACAGTIEQAAAEWFAAVEAVA